MNRWRVQLLLLFGLIVFALPLGTDGQRSARESAENDVRVSLLDAKKQEQLSEKDFPYVVRRKTQKPCILANMTIAVTVPYIDKNQTKSYVLNVTRNAMVEGNCLSVISNLKLSWKGDKDTENSTIQLIFVNDHSKFSLFSINLNVYRDKNSSLTSSDAGRWSNVRSDMDLRLFAASVTNGIHKCEKEKKVKVGDMQVAFKDVSLIAFNTDDDLSEKKDEQCDDSKNEAKTFPYVLKDADKTCALARMAASFTVSYKTKNSTSSTKPINVPPAANVSGICGPKLSSMIFTWNNNATAARKNSVEFYFKKEEKSTFIDVLNVNIFLDEGNFPDAADIGKELSSAVKLNAPLAPAENGIFNCPSNITLRISDEINMTISDVLLVAFDVQQDFALKRVGDCRASLSANNFAYVVQDPAADVPCTLANMSIDVHVPYRKGESNTNKTLRVPIDATSTGSCARRGEMKLNWSESADNTMMNTVTFFIAQNDTHSFVYNVEGTIYLDEKKFPDATDKNKPITGLSNFSLALFAAPLDTGLYSCSNRTEKIGLGNFDLFLTDVSFVAYNTDEYLDSKQVRSCEKPATETTTVVTTPSTTPSTISSTEQTTASTPVPNVGYDYVVKNQTTSVICTVANISISMKIPFPTKDANKTTILKVPKTARTSGTCDEPKSTMKLTWTVDDSDASPKSENHENNVIVTFEKKESEYSILSIKLDIYMDQKTFPDVYPAGHRYEAVTQNLSIFSAPLNNLYKCAPETVVRAEGSGITIKDITLLAFNGEENIPSKSVNCVSSKSVTNIGAIVGGVLGAAAVVGLVGFLFVMYKRNKRLC